MCTLNCCERNVNIFLFASDTSIFLTKMSYLKKVRNFRFCNFYQDKKSLIWKWKEQMQWKTALPNHYWVLKISRLLFQSLTAKPRIKLDDSCFFPEWLSILNVVNGNWWRNKMRDALWERKEKGKMVQLTFLSHGKLYLSKIYK